MKPPECTPAPQSLVGGVQALSMGHGCSQASTHLPGYTGHALTWGTKQLGLWDKGPIYGPTPKLKEQSEAQGASYNEGCHCSLSSAVPIGGFLPPSGHILLPVMPICSLARQMLKKMPEKTDPCAQEKWDDCVSENNLKGHLTISLAKLPSPQEQQSWEPVRLPGSLPSCLSPALTKVFAEHVAF